MFKNRAVPLYKRNVSEDFVLYVTVWLVRIWTLKMRRKKRIFLKGEAKANESGRKIDTV